MILAFQNCSGVVFSDAKDSLSKVETENPNGDLDPDKDPNQPGNQPGNKDPQANQKLIDDCFKLRNDKFAAVELDEGASIVNVSERQDYTFEEQLEEVGGNSGTIYVLGINDDDDDDDDDNDPARILHVHNNTGNFVFCFVHIDLIENNRGRITLVESTYDQETNNNNIVEVQLP